MHITPPGKPGPRRPAWSIWWLAAIIASAVAAGLLIAAQPTPAKSDVPAHSVAHEPVGAGDQSGGTSGAPTHKTSRPGQDLTSPAPEAPGTGTRSGVAGGVLFGGTARLLAEQPALGRKLALVRTYYRLGESFPTHQDRRIMASGTTLLVSLDTKPGGASYAAIAAGHEDPAILSFLKAVDKDAIRYHLAAIYFCFEHEADAPSNHRGLGPPAQFVQAWDHVHQLAVAAHLNWQQGGRVHWVLILLHLGFAPLNARPQWARNELAPSSFWPGASETDAIGVDGYNTVGCGKRQASAPTTPAKVFGPAVDFARSVGRIPVFIAEWGSTPGGNQRLFITQMRKFVRANREIAAVSYWDNPGASCTYVIDHNPAVVSALKAMAHSPTFQGHLAS